MSHQLQGFRSFVARRGGGAWRPTASPIVVVGSGKGGVGTSTVTLLAGIAAADAGLRTLVIDTDEQTGTIHRLAAASAPHALDALVSGAITVTKAIVPVTDRLGIIPGGAPEAHPPRAFTTADRRALLTRCAPVFSQHDLVLIDAGATLDRLLAAVARPVARVVLVASDDPVALAGTHAVLKALDATVRGIPVACVFNRMDERRASGAFAHLRAAARRFLHRGAAYGGAIGEDPLVGLHAARGLSLATLSPESPAAQSATRLCNTVLHAAPTDAEALASRSGT